MKSDLEIVVFRLKLLMKLTDFINKNQMRGKIYVEEDQDYSQVLGIHLGTLLE